MSHNSICFVYQPTLVSRLGLPQQRPLDTHYGDSPISVYISGIVGSVVGICFDTTVRFHAQKIFLVLLFPSYIPGGGVRAPFGDSLRPSDWLRAK